jgi:hypothetical protein
MLAAIQHQLAVHQHVFDGDALWNGSAGEQGTQLISLDCKKQSRQPILDLQIRQRFEVAIRRENDGAVLAAQRGKHHIHLRKGSALFAKFVEYLTETASCFRVERPDADMTQELC